VRKEVGDGGGGQGDGVMGVGVRWGRLGLTEMPRQSGEPYSMSFPGFLLQAPGEKNKRVLGW